MKNDPVDPGQFRAALRLIDGQRRLLQDAHADPAVLRAYEAIIRYLYKMPSGQLDRLLGRKQSPSRARQNLDERAADATDMPLSKVEHMLVDEAVTRTELEAVAIGRFNMPRGSMRSIGNIDHLKELIASFVHNERAHQSITEVARETYK
jgi:hypothetical protein